MEKRKILSDCAGQYIWIKEMKTINERPRKCLTADGGWMHIRMYLFLRNTEICIFLYVKPRMISHYIIMCVYWLMPKFLNCEVKNQVKHMCSLTNHTDVNTSYTEKIGSKNRISFQPLWSWGKLYSQGEN
jgi:hypothetical protein